MVGTYYGRIIITLGLKGLSINLNVFKASYKDCKNLPVYALTYRINNKLTVVSKQRLEKVHKTSTKTGVGLTINVTHFRYKTLTKRGKL